MNNRIRHGAGQCLAVVLSAMLVFSTAVMVYAGAPDVPIGTISPDTSNWSSENAAVNFTIPQYTVTASPCANGSVIVGKNQTYATDTVTVTVTPAANYELNYIAVNGANIGNATSFEMPPRNTTVQVYFKSRLDYIFKDGAEIQPIKSTGGSWVFNGGTFGAWNDGQYLRFLPINADNNWDIPRTQHSSMTWESIDWTGANFLNFEVNVNIPNDSRGCVLFDAVDEGGNVIAPIKLVMSKESYYASGGGVGIGPDKYTRRRGTSYYALTGNGISDANIGPQPTDGTRTLILSADLTQLRTKKWNLRLTSKGARGTNYSANWGISKIWVSSERPFNIGLYLKTNNRNEPYEEYITYYDSAEYMYNSF